MVSMADEQKREKESERKAKGKGKRRAVGGMNRRGEGSESKGSRIDRFNAPTIERIQVQPQASSNQHNKHISG